MNRAPLLVLALALSAPVLHAATISVLAGEDPALAAPESTERVVTGFMDSLFESGHIATSSRTVVAARSDFAPKDRDLAEAREAYVDYLVLVHIEYAPSALRPGKPRPTSAAYRVFVVASGLVVFEGRAVQPEARDETEEGYQAQLASLGKAIAKACSEAIARGAASRPGGKP
ncbi:MAG: hypothetical protein JNG85_13470 [Spirochaetaceae bacterium]|nr:hypothetical protein [Spirochaetaceae bacterium]